MNASILQHRAPFILTRRFSRYLFEHAAEIYRGRKTAFIADLLDSIASLACEIELGVVYRDLMLIGYWRHSHKLLENVVKARFAEIAHLGKLFYRNLPVKIGVYIVQRILYYRSIDRLLRGRGAAEHRVAKRIEIANGVKIKKLFAALLFR